MFLRLRARPSADGSPACGLTEREFAAYAGVTVSWFSIQLGVSVGTEVCRFAYEKARGRFYRN